MVVEITVEDGEKSYWKRPPWRSNDREVTGKEGQILQGTVSCLQASPDEGRNYALVCEEYR